MMSRRSIISMILLLGLSSGLSAQLDTTINQDQFLFPEFSVGVVKMENGEKVVLNLNYNIVSEKMVFKQNNQIFDITNTDAIDTVYISGGKFIPSGKVFFEVLVNAPVSLFVQYKGNVKKPSRPAAYGGTSDVSSSTYINNIKIGNDRFRMQNNSKIIIEEDALFWARKNNQIQTVTGKKNLNKFFGDKKNDMKGYIRKNQLNVETPEDMGKIITFYNGLLR